MCFLLLVMKVECLVKIRNFNWKILEEFMLLKELLKKIGFKKWFCLNKLKKIMEGLFFRLENG